MTNTTVSSIMRLSISSLLLLMLIACNHSNNKPNVSGIKIDLKIERFDKDFFSMDTNQLSKSLTDLNKKYPTFYPLYAEFLSPTSEGLLDPRLVGAPSGHRTEWKVIRCVRTAP